MNRHILLGDNKLLTGKLEINLKDKGITIEICSDGYSVTDLTKPELEEKFDEPLTRLKIVKEPESYENKLKKERKHGELEKEEEEKIKQEINKKEEEIANVKNALVSLIKSYNPQHEIEIEIFEPPLGFETKMENGTFKRKLRINREAALKLHFDSEDSKFNEHIQFSENKTYYLLVKKDNSQGSDNGKKNNNQSSDDNKFRLEVSTAGVSPQGVIKPYKGAKNSWTINFYNNLFYGTLVLFKGNEQEPLFKIPIYILPEKIEIKESMQIVEELLRLHSSLIFDYTQATGLSVYAGEIGKRNPIQVLNLIRYIWEKRNLSRVLQSIIDNPHKVLITEEILKDIGEVAFVSPYRIPEMILTFEHIREIASPGHFEHRDKKYQFIKAYDEFVKITHDTYPNRFVKFFLKLLYGLVNWALGEIKNADTKEKKGYYEKFLSALIKKSEEICTHITRFLSKDFFQEVTDLKHLSQPPLVLLKEERYSTVFRSYLEIINGIKTDEKLEELLKDPIANMPELYEYWCFLKVAELVIDNFSGEIKFGIDREIIEKGKIKIHEWKISGWTETEPINLEYQKKFEPNNKKEEYSYSVGLCPDIYLRIKSEKSNDDKDIILLFDAKYRVDFIDEILSISSEQTEQQGAKGDKQNDSSDNKFDEKIESIKRAERRGTFKLADLYKMHTYREAIVRRIEEKKRIKRPRWVFALYPGKKLALYTTKDRLPVTIVPENGNLNFEIKQDKKELKIIIGKGEHLFHLNGGVGAIPFRPALLDNSNYKKFICDLLKKLLNKQ